MSKLLALYSPAPGMGKSTAAQYLAEQFDFTIVKFADCLKDMLRVMLFDHVGLSHKMTERYVDGDLKETVIPQLGVTPRHIQVTLGTEWGRDMIRADLWVHITRMRLERLQAANVDVVIDDMRFRNEFDAIHGLGGVPVKIVRPNVYYKAKHRSEGGLDDVPMRVITNGGQVCDLEVDVARLVGDLTSA